MTHAPELTEAGRARPASPASASLKARSARPLVWILLAGAALRLAIWAWGGGLEPQIWDERDYNALAVNLAKHGEFAFSPGRPTSIRPPLYPALVSAVYQLCGLENHRAVHLLQAVISLGLVALIYGIGTMLDAQKVGTWAAALCAFYPSLVWYNNLLLTEVLFTTLLVATCWCLILAYQRDVITLLLVSGLLLGLATLTRSVLWLFPPVFGVYLLLSWRGNFRRRVLAALVFTLGFTITIAPWVARNSRLQETLVIIDVMGGRNFMMGNYAYTPLNRAWATIEIKGERSWLGVLKAEHPDLPSMTQGQLDKLALRSAIHFVLDHPWLTLKRSTVKFFNFWGLERELIAGAALGYFGPISKPTLVLMTLLIFGSYAVAMIAGIFGAVVRPPADWRSHGLLLLLIVFICGLHTLAFGHSRYHLPLLPLVLCYAAIAIVHGKEIWSQRRQWTFALACVLSGVLVASWAVEVLIVDLDRFVAALRATA